MKLILCYANAGGLRNNGSVNTLSADSVLKIKIKREDLFAKIIKMFMSAHHIILFHLATNSKLQLNRFLLQ